MPDKLHSCRRDTGALILPAPEDLDGLSAPALVEVVTKAAALQARASANLTLLVASAQTLSAPAQDDQLTTGQVAVMLNAKTGWVYRHWKKLGGVKLDGILRFPRRRVMAYVERMGRLSG